MMRSANSPTFLVASTSPTRNRTANAFSTATTSEMWRSESHSSTSLALSSGVTFTGSVKMSSKIVCILVMTSAWSMRPRDPDPRCSDREGARVQLELAPAIMLRDEGEAYLRVEVPHHVVLRGGEVDAAHPRRAPLEGEAHDLVHGLLLDLTLEHAAAHQPGV